MVDLTKAWKLIEKNVEPLPAKNLALFEASGCKLVENVASKLDIPGYALATSDGVAIRRSDLKGAGQWTISYIKGDSVSHQGRLQPNRAVHIKTGELLPDGADMVLTAAEAELGKDCVIIEEKPGKWLNCTAKGGDIRKGERVYKNGSILKPVDVAVLSSLGVKSVKVIPQPDIVVLGVYPPETQTKGMIPKTGGDLKPILSCLYWDGYLKVQMEQLSQPMKTSVSATLRRHAGSSLVIAVIDDECSDAFYDTFARIDSINLSVIFKDVNVEPASNSMLAQYESEPSVKSGSKKQSTWILTLRGNPPDLLVGYFQFVRRVLSRLYGRIYKPVKVKSTLVEEIRVKVAAKYVLGVKLIEGGRGPRVRPIRLISPNHVANFAEMDGFIYLRKGENLIEAGSLVDVEWI